ncbi:unnamed protein product [Parnassius apollo]|uniref:(apollo) hypothetical protein n=1 Tax=Parnassius apollo TaxID=110799 RepID=A0A8S3WV44_PARAO|nr:unnamed protein product [Parnassius apollo]
MTSMRKNEQSEFDTGKRRGIHKSAILYLSSLQKCTGASLMRVNLQRSRVATAELLQVASNKGVSITIVQEPYVGKNGVIKEHPGTRVVQCSLNRQKPVKAAVLIFGDQLEIIHDPQLVTETEAAVLLVAGNLKLGVVSVYLEGEQDINPYLRRIQAACAKLHTNNIIVAGDINAWSQWWGSNSEDERGAAYNTFLNEMDLHILNTGDTPTFETYRRGENLFEHSRRHCLQFVTSRQCGGLESGEKPNYIRPQRDYVYTAHQSGLDTIAALHNAQIQHQKGKLVGLLNTL